MPIRPEALAPDVVADACRTHPHLLDGDHLRAADYGGLEPIVAPFDGPLAEAPPETQEVVFDARTVGAVRIFVTCQAAAEGLAADRRDDLVLAVDELATNSVRHGGGRGSLRVWSDDDAVVCEVRDTGLIADPLAGRSRPGADQTGGFGLWLVHQLCDLVELRTSPTGTVVRVRMGRG